MLGVRDWDKAPSPKKLLKTLGILKITTNISWITLEPRIAENTKSLIYPKILEIRVKKLNPKEDFQKFEIFNYFFSESKSKDMELTQYLKPVLSTGPSLNTWPKWPSQFEHNISVLGRPKIEWSSR